MSTASSLQRLEKDRKRRRMLARCKTDLWYLLTEVLDYGWNPKAGGGELGSGKGLTPHFHEPICHWLDTRREVSFLGMWFLALAP